MIRKASTRFSLGVVGGLVVGVIFDNIALGLLLGLMLGAGGAKLGKAGEGDADQDSGTPAD
ncbi:MULTISPECIES: hypothetical protein [Novosphingobium]|uniref:Glycine zipper-like domain-containing protein n=1 Tax=Novosphingobium decolorationis TaxID=2698673 RepID=A0ABX8E979_9SPHN|nr:MULTISPECIES: hypothetical protein [Novosphingobium]MED5546976.1 hypothetical protein [Pseudomonadota bacterium]QVM85692.1 hypothetical protein HT578_20070 [Novosphingobium decolorationis]GAM07352.1 hypothetical protein MBENS4_4348 [Novosphingobium sp. MBES04]